MKSMTVFYSLKGETIAPGYKIENLEKGHTARMAETVASASGSDIYEIRTVKEYSRDHMKMIYEAKEEIDSGMLPELEGQLPDLDGYDLIYLGYPNWWNTLPTPVSSFLSRYSWDGKRIAPFCTSMESGFGRSLKALEAQAKGAAVLEGLHVRSADVGPSSGLISEWSKRVQS